MSEEGDIDVESAEDVPDIAVEATATTMEDRSELYSPTDGPLDKRAHHNALERRRRDHIKDSFHGLRDSIPHLHGEKISRACILNKATEYIRVMQKSGSSREGEIQDLKRRNEVLEEQVRALEAAKALGSTENAEDILQSVAEKIESKQRQQQDKANTATTAGKPERNNTDKTGKTSQQPSGGSSKQSATVAKGGETPVSLSNHLNLLAKNQSLLSALQKNLSSPNLPANIKSLAARVLASPLGRTQVNTGGNLPRGIVTATTVPKGSSFTSSPLPSTLHQQLQQAKPSQAPIQPAAKSATDSPPKLPKTNATPAVPPSDVSNCTSSATASLDSPAAQDKPANDTSSALLHDGGSEKSGSKSEPAVSTASLSSVTSSASSTAVTAASLTSQLMDAHSLLQQQGAGVASSVASSAVLIPQLSPELLAQVSSFLNLPGQTTPQPAVSESAAGMSTSNAAASESALESLSTEAVSKGVKRPNSSQDLDSEHTVKKIHLEA